MFLCTFAVHMNALLLSARYYRLEFDQPFGIALGTRTHTDTIYVNASFMGVQGYGEAALPPYLGYQPEKLVADFHNYFPGEMHGSEAIRTTLARLGQPENLLPKPLKTAVDIALYDLFGKLTERTTRSIFGIPDTTKVPCSYTLGISSIEAMLEKIKGAQDFELFKIKLGGETDLERVDAFLSATNAAFCVDANQAWSSVESAVQWTKLLKDRGCLFVEQPLPVAMHADYAKMLKMSALPIILDESVQGLKDVDELKDVCNGVNVKLVKTGGLEPAVAMVRQANKLGLKVLIGCMSESTCGAMAAAQLSGWADWVDLDGPRLIKNDPFSGAVYKNGSLVLSADAGTGAQLNSVSLFS